MVFFQGNITNREKLCKKYNLPLYTDNNTLLELMYTYHKENMVYFLEGTFLIGIEDKINKKVLLIRDKMGTKSLYYSVYKGKIIYSPNLKKVVKAIFPTPQINEASIYLFLTFLALPEKMTFFQNVWKVEAGSYVLYENGILKRKEYWNASDYLNDPIEINQAESADYIDYLLTQTIGKLKDPYCLALSGGIDSSLLALYSEKIGKIYTPINIIINQDYLSEEQQRIQKIDAYRKGTEIKICSMEINKNILSSSSRSIVENTYEPLQLMDIFIILNIFANVPHKEICLFGEGADELGGYPEYKNINQLYYLSKIKNNSILNSFRDQSYITKRHLVAMNETEKRVIWRGKPCKECSSYIIDLYNQITIKSDDIFLRKLQNVDIKFRLPEYLLKRTNLASQIMGIEAMFPFLDEELVKFCLRLDKRNMINTDNAKCIFRKLLKKYLPIEEWDKPKLGMGDGLKYYIDTLVFSNYIKEIHCQKTHPLFKFLKKEKIIELTRNNTLAMWAIYSLGIWLEVCMV